MKKIKKLFLFLFIGILFFLIVYTCTIPEASSEKKNTTKETVLVSDGSAAEKTIGGYPAGMPYINIEASIWANSSDTLVKKYNDWKAIYVISSGFSGQLRVVRDKLSHLDTVSEGIGYGMLLAVYFNDRTTFDGLYKYCKAHFIKVNGVTVPLMHWKVDQYSNNVSEFNDYVQDDTRITANGKYYNSYVAMIPHGTVYGNLTNGKIFITKDDSNWDPVRTALDNNPNYYRMCQNPRGYSSATDADEDIAAALCFAHKKWLSSGSFNYSQEATDMINAMKQYDFTSDGFIKGGNTWGGQNGWNPSYVTPAYYKNVFQKHTGDTFWTTVYDRMYTELNHVKNTIIYSYGTGYVFFPDWCDTTYSGFKQATTATDRLYYSKGKSGDCLPDVDPDPNDQYALNALWSDDPEAKKKENYTAQMLSFNLYYDAIRVPWRIATDYAWGGDKALDIQNVNQQSFYGFDRLKASDNKNLKDGFFVDGSAWKFEYRDGFNRSQGGAPSITFTSMAACSQLVSGVTPDSRYWTTVRDEKIRKGDYSYYGNTLNVLACLFLTGKFVNLYDDKFTRPDDLMARFYRYWNGSLGDHFYTIDYNELGSGKWGWNYEKTLCMVYKPNVIDNGKTVALYRLWNPNTTDHFYTTDYNEADTAVKYYGYKYEGIACNVYSPDSPQPANTIPVYRYWNSGSGDHFYTIDYNELGSGKWGWNYEKIAFYAYESQ